jgi:ketosteroid isomerase-like protein
MFKVSMFSVVIVALFVVASVATAGEDPKVASEVIAMTKAQWAAEMANKSVADQMSIAAEDYTEINGGFAVRIDGKALNVKFGEAGMKDGERTIAADMANAKVQVYGDTAILTYNYIGISLLKDGKTKNHSGLSTRVYAKVGGAWKLVHGHFSPVQPPKD